MLKIEPLPHKDKDGNIILNRYSGRLTGGDNPAAEAMLYGAGIKNESDMKNKPQVGIAAVWWEGNPCNMHLNDLGKIVKQGVEEADMIGWQYSTVGVSDASTMGNLGMRYSLPSRELIADSIESTTMAQWHDGNISIPGCDKNMPGTLMAMARFNRPAIMIYGGTIKPGYSTRLKEPILVSSTLEVLGSVLANGKYGQEDLEEVVRHACPGPGACGGMFTANTMSTAAEALGMSLPGSSSAPAESATKHRECLSAGKYLKVLLEKDIKPRDIMTPAAFENALVITMALGGSTNSVLHLLAIAYTADVHLTMDDFQRVSDKIPFIADLKPSGKYVMEDLYNIGGVPAVMKMLLAAGLMDGSILTVTGKTLAENVKDAPSLAQDQVIVRPLDNPIKKTGHLRILKGNLAPKGCVAKITGKEGTHFVGEARVYDSEQELLDEFYQGLVRPGKKIVICIRYEGPKGGPGMPEMLKASSVIMGAGFGKDIALITDGRYSGASHGFIIGHICPEAMEGGPIAVLKTGDMIEIDSEKNTINILDVTDEELQARFSDWTPPKPSITRGSLAKYAKLVSDSSKGCVTDAELF
ncbi:hypothetical protein CANCADRAFT_125682 [Tortispora caseinolytica NRRL Y-17796]|uniref:dihydroxy-acid dehydratase n=1 Tax=Tortispora caseinolytica NRRL Y-17796 TaxID=767744 RepID=A0A1E4TA25_9ASCO|nr:hypothetical protein CANCADRAFT_125682 [Tortispora caseinolytica NRRL Y-17796]